MQRYLSNGHLDFRDTFPEQDLFRAELLACAMSAFWRVSWLIRIGSILLIEGDSFGWWELDFCPRRVQVRESTFEYNVCGTLRYVVVEFHVQNNRCGLVEPSN